MNASNGSGGSGGSNPVVRFLFVAAAFVIVVAGIRAAESILSPLLMALFIAVVAQGPLVWLNRKGVPRFLAVTIVFGTLCAALVGVGGIVGSSVREFRADLPTYQKRLSAMADRALVRAQDYGLAFENESLREVINPSKAIGYAGELFNGLGGTITNAFLILLLVVFLVSEADTFPRKMVAAFEEPERSMQQYGAIMDSIADYFGIKTLTSVATGLVIGLWLWFLGLDYPILWGTLAFLLNYVPNIGSIIAAVPAVALALVQLGPASAGWTAFAFLLVNNVIGNFVEPKFMGNTLGLSTLVVFVSLVFWGWALGPSGMFLSVPLTMAVKVALDQNPSTRPIAVLLGSEIPKA